MSCTMPAVAYERVKDIDTALARAAATGEGEALADLYQRHSRRVYALCLRMTRDIADAEDLTQEVFIQLHRKIGSYRGDSHFSTWLHRLTVNQVLMFWRRAKRRNVHCMDLIEAADLNIARTSKDPSGSRVADGIALDTAVNQLPPGSRAVFLLFSVQGYRHEEIASMCGCTVGTSKSQLHKARKKLKRMLVNTGSSKTPPITLT
ncbi:MAG TPA: RNA polymerase sigma factor [Pyrinomonadaceae bacterium]|nr:RNA polymerase sigma factor [Pyrinomonadaceae bacterium]